MVILKLSIAHKWHHLSHIATLIQTFESTSQSEYLLKRPYWRIAIKRTRKNSNTSGHVRFDYDLLLTRPSRRRHLTNRPVVGWINYFVNNSSRVQRIDTQSLRIIVQTSSFRIRPMQFLINCRRHGPFVRKKVYTKTQCIHALTSTTFIVPYSNFYRYN